MPTQSREPIAIVGSGCRFPGEGNTPSKLWDLLSKPRDCLTEIPSDRFNWEGYYHEDGIHGSSNTKHAHFLSEGVRKFDPHFFNIQPTEADAIDPQQRLLLETVYESLDSGGLTLEGLQGSPTAVFVGLMGCDYAELVQRDLDSAPTYTGTGTARSIHSNRISYFFDWHGPSMTIDTACSSSMMAIHLAIQTLRSGESHLAVACGASLIIGPENYVILNNLNMLAPDGRVKMWDESANGYARGEGVAAIALKTLSAAIADGDHIECIIRETGVNQDGRTKGLTMPSELAQAELIRQTYERAGLDISKKEDRPQFFEAHGTGTPAGDPKEAEAVHNAFFPAGGNYSKEDTIYIGSIKTVVGHTEGTAGIAGILKASLALQNKFIPPNLLFNKLSPTVAPFAKHLQLPTTLVPWPDVPEGNPRRASVNSFGFGGSNGHAILESWDNNPKSSKPLDVTSPIFTPFVFSAASERSLVAVLEANMEYLKQHEDINLRDFAWTLQHRTSTFPFKTIISAQNMPSLCSQLATKIEAARGKEKTPVGVKTQSKASPRILGVFTGQGAQWAGMGRELILASAHVREILQSLDQSLAELPDSDRPSWSIVEELLKDTKTSRLSEAVMSQPLCTAIQIVLVDLLEAAGVTFKAVVGHSSGEIGAAYAAKFISASDAIRIAYYRGFGVKLSATNSGKKGGMLAVGTSTEDAVEFCELPDFEGRLSVAACNSSSSVTLSGDFDAIEEAKLVFEEEKKFARILKVDTAYHSLHMEPWARPYAEKLEKHNIKILKPDENAPIWYSSVQNGEKVEPSDELRADYWRKNMVQAVLFQQAVESAVSQAGPFDVALEVGPHPALKGPATQTIQDIAGINTPYSGVLSRGQNDVDAFSGGLGFVWTHLGQQSVKFSTFDQIIAGSAKPVFLKDHPVYPWDHERSFWYDSRVSRAHRMRKGPIHSLLGSKSGDSTETNVKWRNFLIPKEIPWLNDHQLQGQPVFPAAAYAAMAWEAAMSLTEERPIKLIEIKDLTIGRPITFNDDTNGVEIHFSLANIEYSQGSVEAFHANWTCHSCPNKESGALVLVSSGTVVLTLGNQEEATFPPRSPRRSNMIETDPDDFYAGLSDLGYGYTGPFRAVTSLQRKMNHSTGVFSVPTSKMLMHPALLDIAFQALFAAVSYPGDGGLWSLHVPTAVHRITLNPYHFKETEGLELDLPFDATLVESSVNGTLGDVEVYTQNGEVAIMQVEGVSSVPFSGATAADDRNLFSEVVWDLASPDGEAVINGHRATAYEIQYARDCERVAHFYLKKLHETISPEEYLSLKWNFQKLLDFAAHVVYQVSAGDHPYGTLEWDSDTQEQILAIIESYPDGVDFQIMREVGESFVSVVREESTALEHLTRDNMLYDFYNHGLGFGLANTWTASMIKQISHRYPHMKVMEIGAGTGGATKAVLDHLGRDFATYTYTDISPAFFDKAQEKFKSFSSKMNFKTFDMEKDTEAQGFTDESFDLIFASNVLHATKNLDEVMQRVRRLLKPGGYLVLLEITDNSPTRMAFIMGGLPGWWIGYDEGRQWAPTLQPAQWNSLLQRTGFSGIDAITSPKDILPYPFSVIASQAVDDRIDFLKQPLISQGTEKELGNLQVIGGKTVQVSKLIDDVSHIVGTKFKSITTFKSLEEYNTESTSVAGNILCLTDLDEPVFKDMTADKLAALKQMFGDARNVIWATPANDPYANMSVGLGRSLCCEMHELRLQIININDSENPDPSLLSEMLVRLRVTEIWESDGQLNNLLWSTEPEILLETDRQLIPRMYPNRDQNERYNSKRRYITTEKSPQTSRVSISPNGTSYNLRETSYAGENTGTDSVTIKVTHSLLSSIKIKSVGYMFLSMGTVAGTGDTVIALSETNSSIITVPKAFTQPCTTPMEANYRFLLAVATEILARNILAMAPPKGKLLVYGAEPLLLSAVIQKAEETSKQVFKLTNEPSVEASSVSIHAQAFESYIKATLPYGISVFLNLSNDASGIELCERVVKALPAHCKVKESSALFATDSSGFSEPSYSTEKTGSLLEAACLQASSQLNDNQNPTISPVPIKEVLQTSTQPSLTTIDWTADQTIPVTIEPIGSKIHFSPDKTYLLIGLTADLGQSLCEWFVRHGARYVVITSRNPRVEKKWLDTLTSMGATVKVFSMDITDKGSLHSVYDEIKKTLPPIGGVANAAMVLQDIMFSNMEIDNLLPVLKPKVDGSRYLDELFSDIPLDFFILFSSLALVVGNSGQTSYTAANGFMASLVTQRRKRGLSASVMDIGAIIGVGYITRAGQMRSRDVNAYGAYALSEPDFLELFGEAVLASPADSGLNPEIVAGLRAIDPIIDDRVPWRTNPKFSHFWVDQDENQGDSGAKKSVASAKSQLLEATSKEQARDIVQASFTARLLVLLQLPVEDMDEQLPLIELGVDSLVGVEVRSWFTKELGVEVPVLKILGGASATELVNDASDKISPELMPKISPDTDVAQTAPAKVAITRSRRELMAEKSTNPTKSSLRSSTPDSESKDSEPSINQTPYTSNSSDSGIEIKEVDFKPVVVRSEPQSYAQSRFWSLQNSLEDQTALNITFSHHLKGDPHLHDLERAIQIIGELHEGLRTSFFEDSDQMNQPVQGVLEKSPLRLERRNIKSADEAAIEFAQLKNHVYNLSNGETMRIILLTLSPVSSYLVIGYHHIAMDGAGFERFFGELTRIWGRQNLSPPSLQYADYSNQQRSEIKNGQMKAEVAYWKKQFPDMPPTLPLFPFSRNHFRQPLKTYSFNTASFKIESVLASRIKRRCRNFQVTAFHFYLAVLKTLLFRFLDTEDLCIGIADSNKDDEVQRPMGVLLNLLPLRFKSKMSQTFGDAVKEARKTAHSALANSKLPFDVVLESVNVERSASHTPIFQVFMDYRQGVQEHLAVGDCEVQRIDWASDRTGYDISLVITENSSGDSSISMNAQSYLYSQTNVEMLMKSYVALLEAFSSNPGMRQDEPPLFTNAEISKAVEAGKGPDMQSDWPPTLIHRIDGIVDKIGTAIALKDGDGHTLSYNQMSDEVNNIADALISSGVNSGEKVAVFQRPTTDSICSLLAIMRIGAIYVPLDLRTTIPRLLEIIDDCKPSVILTHSLTVENMTSLALEEIKIINITGIELSTHSQTSNAALAESTAVILYVNGSIGVPNGIILKHSALQNVVQGVTKQFNVGAEIILQQSGLNSSLSIDQIFMAVSNGGTLVIVPQPKREDSVEIAKIIADEQVTYTLSTPSEYSSWLSFGANDLKRASEWRFAFSGGERLTPMLKQEFGVLGQSQLRLINSYGPAEITIQSHKVEIPYLNKDEGPDDSIPVGFALPNYSVYIVDKLLKTLPVGISGEICIGGAGVSPGYVNSETLTKLKFLPDVFASAEWKARGWNKMYRTGDKGRLAEDGSLLLEGRIADDA